MAQPEPPPTSFTRAVCAHRRLRSALSQAGFDSAEFPRMVADVDPLGEPRVAVGPISADTAERLAAALEEPDTEPAP